MSSQVFPSLPGLKMRITRTPLSRTVIQSTPNGQELRVRRWAGPKYRYTLSFEFLRKSGGSQDEVAQLQAFIDAHGGNWDSFLYDDPIDGVRRRVRFENGDDGIEFERIASGIWAVGDIELVTTTIDYGSRVATPLATATTLMLTASDDSVWMVGVDDYGALSTYSVFTDPGQTSVILASPNLSKWAVTIGTDGALTTAAYVGGTAATTVSLKSTNGTVWSVTVDDDGALRTTEVP